MEKKRVSISSSSAVLEVETRFHWYSETAKKHCECGLRIGSIPFWKKQKKQKFLIRELNSQIK